MRSKIIAAMATLILLSACSLSGDITPPPGYESPTLSAQETVYPIVPADQESGAAIFAQECASCHGELGAGNGPKSTALPVDVPAIGTREVSFDAHPVEWYNVVTNGRLERGMPPFASLSDRNRWDVVAYTLAMHTSQEQLDSARAVYLLQCQGCHGRAGEGTDGQNVPDWTQPERLAQFSEEELFQVLTHGSGDMPAFGDTLDSGQRLALVAYARSLSFASASRSATTESTATPETGDEGAASTLAAPAEITASQPEKVTLSGEVVRPSGEDIPAGLEATLSAYDDMQLSFTQTAALGKDGSFRFKDIELSEGRVFLVAVSVQGVDFYSDALQSNELTGGQETQLVITIYEVSHDISLLRGERLHVFFDFTDPEMVQVVELLTFSNPGEAVVAPASPGGVLLSFKLPSGATHLQFEDGTLGDGTYVQTADGFGVSAVYAPAEDYQVLFAYNLPFNRKSDLELELPLDITRAVLMVPAKGVRIKSDSLENAGQSDMEGIQLQLYTSTDLAANTPLKFTLSGRPSEGAEFNAGSTTSLIVGIGAFMLVSAGAVVSLLRRRKTEAMAEEILEGENPEALMDAIIALDDRRRSGELEEAAYRTRRGELKQRLQQLLGEKGTK